MIGRFGVFLTCGQVAAMFTVDPKTVTRWANAGLIPVVRTPGGRRRYPEAEVLKFFESLTRQDGEVEQ